MLVQGSLNYSEYFFSENLLVEYFLILILSIELSVFFIFQHVRRANLSPKWILSFSVILIGMTLYFFLRALNDLIFNTPSMSILSNKLNFIIVSACSIATGYFMLDFFKKRGKRARLLSASCIALGMTSTIMGIFTLFSSWNIQPLVTLTSLVSLLVVILFPVYLLIQLVKRDDSGRKKFFKFILVGILIIFTGMAFNFKIIDDLIKKLSPDSYNIYKFIILVLIITGLSIIGLSAFYIPPIDDFLWIDNLVALYIIEKNNQKVLFKKIFNLEAIEALPFGSKDDIIDGANEEAFLGGISGITDILSETLIDSNKKVESIDQGAIKLLLSHESTLLFILLVKQTVPILNWKLKQFKETFMLFYGDLVERFVDTPEKFLPVERIVARIFNSGTKTKNTTVKK